MFEFDPVVVRFVSYRVCTRNRSFAQGGDDDLRKIVAGFIHPARLPPDFADDPFCQRDGRAARSILFLCVVNLFDPYVVGVEALHHPGQPAVEAEHQVYPQAVVRGVEQRPALLAAQFLELRQTIRPARRAAHHGGGVLDAGADIAVGGRGHGEFQRHVRLCEVGGVQVGRVVRVDHERYAVAAFEEYLLDLAPHLAVTYDSCFHIFPDYKVVQIPYGGCGAGRRCRLCLHAAGAACLSGNLLFAKIIQAAPTAKFIWRLWPCGLFFGGIGARTAYLRPASPPSFPSILARKCEILLYLRNNC